MSERKVYRFGEQEWHVPTSDGTDERESAEAGRQGAKRRFLAQGDSGFFVQVVDIPRTSTHRPTATITPRSSWCSRDRPSSTVRRWARTT